MSQNPPVHPELYQPRNFVISNITTSFNAQVTTTSAYDYVVGQQVRFHVPFAYGMRQANEKSAFVLSLDSSTSFTTDLNTTNFDAFISSPTYPGNTPPQVSAIGDRNLNIEGLTIAGAFQQIEVNNDN